MEKHIDKIVVAILLTVLVSLGVYLHYNKPAKHSMPDMFAIAKNEFDSLKRVDSLGMVLKAKHQQRLDSLLGLLKKRHDDMTGTSFYSDPKTEEFSTSNQCQVYLSLSKQNDLVMRMRINYKADDWLFVKSYQFKCADSIYDYTPRNVNTEVHRGIREWSDELADEEIIKAISKVDIVKMRYNGSSYYDDRYLSKQEIAAIKNVYSCYAKLKTHTSLP